MLTPFLQYVSEARVVRRQSDLKRYTFQEITERIYLSFLTLSLLKNFSQTADFASSYGRDTLSGSSFERVRSTSNDLSNMLAVVAGDPKLVQKLANKNQAMALRQRQSVPVLAIRRYLRTLKDDYAFLTGLESALDINNSSYRNLRRAISDYPNLDSKRKKVVATRLLQALKSKLPGTDLQRKAQEFSDKQRLELKNVIDAERSAPGSEITPNELTGYRMLVGDNNAIRAKIATDMVRQGKSVPAPIMSAFTPVISMVDDIVNAGVAYVQLLKSVHARAKSKSKR